MLLAVGLPVARLLTAAGAVVSEPITNDRSSMDTYPPPARWCEKPGRE